MPQEIYCPRCSKPFTDGESYCRTCGLPLAGVADIVQNDTDSAPEVRTRPNSELMRVGFGVFILGTVIALINAAVRDFGLFPEGIGKVIFLTFIAMGLLITGVGVVFPKKYYLKKSRREQGDHPKTLRTSELAPQTLPPASEDFLGVVSPIERQPIGVEYGSVTEHTTRKL